MMSKESKVLVCRRLGHIILLQEEENDHNKGFLRHTKKLHFPSITFILLSNDHSEQNNVFHSH